ncbi:hypothetical protein GCM10010498_43360 [Streptomyces cavourensis]|nr:hypothetical protein GCM10010498_43360 [Streptomyces cavourensis]
MGVRAVRLPLSSAATARARPVTPYGARAGRHTGCGPGATEDPYGREGLPVRRTSLCNLLHKRLAVVYN